MAQLNSLDAKVVWITGASSGLGEALAKECALQGAEVILTARRFDELEKVRVGLLNPDQHFSICADITDEAQVRHAYEQVLQKKGRIDWLINNAGLSQRALIADTSMQTERAIMEVDYFSQVFFNQNCSTNIFSAKIRSYCLCFECCGTIGDAVPCQLFSSQGCHSYVGK